MRSIWDKLASEIGARETGQDLFGRAVPVEKERSWRDWRWWANRSYRMACFGIGLVLLESFLLGLKFSVVKTALPFIVLNLAAALHSVIFPSFGRVSFHFILTYGNLLLFGPGVAALSSGIGIFGHHLLVRRRPLSTSMFHMGRAILSIAGAAWTFSALGGRWGWPNLGWTMVISSAAAYLAIGFILDYIPSLWSSSVSRRTSAVR